MAGFVKCEDGQYDRVSIFSLQGMRLAAIMQRFDGYAAHASAHA
jgi:hypothetical protein